MGRYAEAARRARDLTNKQLGEQLSTLNRLTEQELQDLLPHKRDKEAFLELMRLVEEERSTDEQLAHLRDNLESAGKVVFSVLKAFL